MIRVAQESDAAAMLDIYTPIVRDTAISFELEPPSEAEFKRRILQTLENNPWLVLESCGAVAGYAYASEHRVRKAYQWSVDVSVYTHPSCRRRGIGRDLYFKLFDVLRLQGYYNAYAGIALPNEGSVGLHKAAGFRPVGVYQAVGFKRGAWHDVGWWHLPLQPCTATPIVPTPFSRVPDIKLKNILMQDKR